MSNANRKVKENLVAELTTKLEKVSTLVLVDYAGLTVKAQQDLKKRLKTVDAKMVVVKNTLIKIAGEKANLPKEFTEDVALNGPTALVMTEGDPIAPIQAVAAFAKEFELPHLKIGVVDGKFQDKTNLLKLSTLPGKNVLEAQVVGALSSPLYGMVGVLQGNLQKLVYVLNAKAKQG